MEDALNGPAAVEHTTDGADLATIASPALTGAEPQIINGVKVYPTSFIPVKAVLHYPKKSLISMKLWHIEGIHWAVFFGITIFLFIGMWKRPNLR